MQKRSKTAGALAPSVISALAVAAAVIGAVGAAAILMAPVDAIHATPKPSIEFTTAPPPLHDEVNNASPKGAAEGDGGRQPA